MKTRAAELKVGDIIMPPAREIQLWMRRTCQERNLPESALHLTVRDVRHAAPDARGEWLLVTADQTPEWTGDSTPYPFKFKVRPETPWVIIG